MWLVLFSLPMRRSFFYAKLAQYESFLSYWLYGCANFPLIPINSSDNVFTAFWTVALRTSVMRLEILKSEIWQCQNMNHLIHNVEQAHYPSIQLSVSVLSISHSLRITIPPPQKATIELDPVEIHPRHGALPMKKAGHEIFFNPLHCWFIQPVWLHVSENISVEKVVSHK